jgi:hypothetical protein
MKENQDGPIGSKRRVADVSRWRVSCIRGTVASVAGQGRTTGAKRQKERQRAEKRQLKEAKKVQRAAEKAERAPSATDEDPDIAGIVAGPQAPLET